MQVQLGNANPLTPTPDGAPTVTYINIPDSYTCEDIDAKDLALHLVRNPQVTRLPGQEALLTVVHSNGAWAQHSNSEPSWVWSDNPVLEKVLKDFYGVGSRPADFEDTHYTAAGAPGIVPAAALVKDIQNIIVNQGRKIWARGLFGSPASTAPSGMNATGVATAVTASSLTTGSVTVTSGQWNGCLLVAVNQSTPTSSVYANIVDHPAATGATCVLTIDKWYTPGTDGTTGTTPSATPVYFISPGSNPSYYMGLNGTTVSPYTAALTASATDTNLPAEITTALGGLKRKATSVSTTVTSSSSNVVLTATFTANSNDTLPVGINGVGLFNTATQVTGSGFTGMMFETSFNAQSLPNAILSAANDQVTITETITGA